MPLYFVYTMVQKSRKWPKTQIKGGSCLNTANEGRFRLNVDGCISWDATSGGWPLRVRKFRVESDWNHAKFVWTCGVDAVDVRGRPTLVICLVDRCAGACLQAKAGLGDTRWMHLTVWFFLQFLFFLVGFWRLWEAFSVVDGEVFLAIDGCWLTLCDDGSRLLDRVRWWPPHMVSPEIVSNMKRWTVRWR